VKELNILPFPVSPSIFRGTLLLSVVYAIVACIECFIACR